MDWLKALNEQLKKIPVDQRDALIIRWFLENSWNVSRKWRNAGTSLYWKDTKEKALRLEKYLFEQGFISRENFSDCFVYISRSNSRIVLANVGIPKDWKPCDFYNSIILIKLIDWLEGKNVLEKRKKKYKPLVELFTLNGGKMTEDSLKNTAARQKDNYYKNTDKFEMLESFLESLFT